MFIFTGYFFGPAILIFKAVADIILELCGHFQAVVGHQFGIGRYFLRGPGYNMPLK